MHRRVPDMVDLFPYRGRTTKLGLFNTDTELFAKQHKRYLPGFGFYSDTTKTLRPSRQVDAYCGLFVYGVLDNVCLLPLPSWGYPLRQE